MQLRFGTCFALFTTCLTAAACGGDGSGSSPATGGTAGTGTGGTAGTGAGGTAGTGGVPAECMPGPGYGTAAAPFTIDSLSASVIDEAGAPASEILAQVCGTDICINAKTDSSGSVTITPQQAITKPAFKYGLGFTYARFAIPLPMAPAHDLGMVRTVRLPPAPGMEMTPGGVVSSSNVSLTLAANTEIKIDKLTYATPADQGFRAVEVDLADPPAAIDPTQNLAMVFATTPLDTTFCPPAQLTVPNTAGLPAGAAVEFVMHGLKIEEEWAPYGGWAVVSDGTVSADGATVSTNPDGGVPMLSVFGIRLE